MKETEETENQRDEVLYTRCIFTFMNSDIDKNIDLMCAMC